MNTIKPYYEDESVTLYCSECMDILRGLPDLSVSAVITDPPYSSGGMVRGDRMASTRDKYQQSDVLVEHPDFTGDNRDQRGWVAWCSIWLTESLRVTKSGGIACVFTDWRQLPSTTDAIQCGGWVWRGIVPWDKENGRPMPGRFRNQCEYVVWGTSGPREFATANARYHVGILRGTTPATADRVHASQKPVNIMAKLVEVADPGETILDPFAGSGTTLIAAKLLGRKAIGIEINEGFCEIAADRLRQGALFAGGAA